ncbi:MAG: hypothetical protein GY822_08090 [Deltaproteobacteria bacterium]|nr:hypothetical protein [Deltaproteobacteria bacterium]
MSKSLIALQNRFLGQGDTVYDRLAQLHDEKGIAKQKITQDDLVALSKETNSPPAHVFSVAQFMMDLGTLLRRRAARFATVRPASARVPLNSKLIFRTNLNKKSETLLASDIATRGLLLSSRKTMAKASTS